MNKKEGKEIKKTSAKKIQIKDKKKFIITIISIVVILIILVILIITLNKKVDISNVSDYSTLNISKYSDELLAKYQTNESKEKFLQDQDLVQGAVGLYILNNSTTDADSFSKIIKELEDILKNEEFDKLSIDKPKYWNGKWQIKDDGTVCFKFGSKDIIPSWVDDEDISNLVVKE